MSRRSKSILLAIFLLYLILASRGLLNPFLAGGPYKGRVIDAESKKPLEGAVVLAVWDSVIPAIADKKYLFLDAEEVLTDSNGRFVVGKHPPMTWTPAAWVEGPDITIFYPGYGFYPRYHASPPMPLGGTETMLEMMEKEKVEIELPRLKSREERVKVQGGVIPSLAPDEKMRNLIRLLNLERQRLGFEPVHTK